MFITNRWFSITLVSFILVSFHENLPAKTITIKLDGSGNYTKIQAGINAASTGDTILVHPGTYTENLNFNGKKVLLGSLFLTTADTTFISKTIIDGNKAGSVILLQNREDLNTVIIGLTIQNSASANAGISLLNSGATIKNCSIMKNAGEGIYALNDSYSIIENNQISNNGSIGVYFGYGARGIVRSNSIIGNRSGISIYLSSPSTIEKNIISSNSGIGIDVDASGATIRFNLINNNGFQGIYCGQGTQIINCTIANNLAGIILRHNSTVKVLNSIIWGNQTKELALDQNANGTWDVTYSLVKGGWPGTGNISTDPLFRDGTPYDYNLTSLSPCINAGDPASPLDPDGTRADMGAFYFDKNSPKKTFISGNVKGTWAKANSPYFVVDHITVQSGDTLIIEPGVEVRFRGHYKFNVFGLLLAIGTKADSILFTRDQPIKENKWWGLRFLRTKENSVLKYCKVEWGNSYGDTYDGIPLIGGVCSKDCSPIISNCLFAHNETPDNPTIETLVALYLYGYSGNLRDCIIYDRLYVDHINGTIQILNNTFLSGVRCTQGGKAVIVENEISNRHGKDVNYGDAVNFSYLEATISDNIIHSSYSGIKIEDCPDTIISKNLIYDNHANYGGGIQIARTAARIYNNTIDSNSADFDGGAIYIGQQVGSIEIFNNIISRNTPGVWQRDAGGSVSIHHNDFYSNSVENCHNCSQGQGNISVDPVFVGGNPFNYHLQSNSPCIDAGDPANPLDPDGTRADIGALYFKQTPVDQTPPAPPQNLRAAAGNQQITLNWNANTETDFLRYRIYGGASPNPSTLIDSTQSVTATTKTIAGLTNGTMYYFRITAVDQSLNVSGFSNEVSATPTQTMLFENITSSAGISGAGITYSVLFNDYNNDGLADLYIIHGTGSTELYKNNGNRTFTSVTGTTSLPSGQYLFVGIMGDYDNDGDLDLFVGSDDSNSEGQIPCILFQNEGNGNFTDVSVVSGIASIATRVFSATWFDFDNDGNLDLFLGTIQKPNNIFLRNLGNKTFANLSANVNLSNLFTDTRGIAAGDFDRDGDIDIFVPNTGPRRNYFLRNDGNVFSEIAASLGVDFSADDSHGAEFADYDNDGDLDLLIGNTANGGSLHLLKNEKGNFSEVTANSGLNSVYTYGSSFNDFDNDGYLDLLVVQSTPTQRRIAFYRNDGNGRFIDATAISGLDTLTIRHTLAVADLDNDGKLDVYIGAYTSDGKDQLYRNIAVTRNWLKVKLNGTSSNKSGIGAWLELTANSKKQYRQITAGEGYRSEDDFIQHFGLGDATIVDSLKIEWPSGIKQVLTNISANQLLVITESKSAPAPPKNLQAAVGNRQITLRWDGNSELNLLRYRIYGSTTPNPTTVIDSVLATVGTTKIIAGLTNGTTYYFRITAVDQNLNASGFSNEVSATPSAADLPPAAPQSLQAVAGNQQITLTWTANIETDFLRYRIYGGTSPNPTTQIDSVNSITATTKALTDLTNGTTYYYRMTAVDQNFNISGFSNEVSATPTAPDLPPSAPQNLRATVGIAQVTLNWNANTESDFLRYRIYGGTTANPTTPIDSVEGAANTSKTITNLMPETTYYFRLTAVDQGLQTSNYSDVVSAIPLADKTAPVMGTISHPQPANVNTAITVSLSITDPSGLKNNVTLYYRLGGASFYSLPMTASGGNTYTQTIPANMVTSRGVEFYVRAEDIYGNVAQTRLSPIRVYCANGIVNPVAQPAGKDASLYRLFSIPLDLTNKAPGMFISANPGLGAADKAHFRWYGIDRTTQILKEYPKFGYITLTPDMGFALLVNTKNLKLKTGSGTTVFTTTPYKFNLPAGWSLIGNPFNYNIPFDSLSVSAGAFELWSFDGDWQINTRGLEPWKGYAIWLSQAATISIRPGLAGLNTGTAFYSVENNDAENWLLQIIANNGHSESRFNFAGQHVLATDEDDSLDLHSPLRLADGVEVAFSNENLKADVRKPSANGHTWDVVCRLNPEDEVLALTFDGMTTVPPTFDVFLIESETAMAYNLRTNPRLQFATRHLAEKRFQLVAGTKAYLHEQSLQAELHPSNFELLQNFPNPFNPATQIIYSLPEARHVEVSVYNLRGERVATLVNEQQASGSHTVVWNAERVGSGVYFIKMRAGRVERIRKCVFVK